MENIKGEKYIIDDTDNKMIQLVSTGDEVDDTDYLNKNIDHVDTWKNKNCIISNSWKINKNILCVLIFLCPLFSPVLFLWA